MDEILQRFLDEAPIAVMVRATIARSIGRSTLNEIMQATSTHASLRSVP
jgi:hypothetical protein